MRFRGTDSSTSRRNTTISGGVEGAAEVQSDKWLVAGAFPFSVIGSAVTPYLLLSLECSAWVDPKYLPYS
jgi:hypothetical protein